MSDPGKVSIDTLAVHAGCDNFQYGPVIPPIYQVSTFAFEDAAHGASLFSGNKEGYIYSRMGNPTVEALENALAALEGGHKALACSSGMAAIHTVLVSLLQAGDHIICSDAVYGPTCILVETILSKFGIESTVADTSDLESVKKALKPNTKVIYVETPGNPTLVVTDLGAISKLAHDHGAQVIVDNTFLGPVLQQPLRWGVDVVVHSLTKSLNGHADVVGGAIIAKDEDAYQNFRKVLNHMGGVLPPFESFLVHRGLKTLAIRMARHCENSLKISNFLKMCPAINWVKYPWLDDHPQLGISRKQTSGGGSVISFELEGGVEAGKVLMSKVKLCTLAVSLGGVETLIQHPASMTHASMGRQARLRGHITDGLVRLSVGIENADDIIADLRQALSQITKVRPEVTCEECRRQQWPTWQSQEPLKPSSAPS